MTNAKSVIAELVSELKTMDNTSDNWEKVIGYRLEDKYTSKLHDMDNVEYYNTCKDIASLITQWVDENDYDNIVD